MNDADPDLSDARLRRLRAQGYDALSDGEIARHAVGNRFAYQLCSLLLIAGLLFTSIPVLAIAAVIAAGAVVLPRHPFDYLYNGVVRHWIDRPQLPPRTTQAKFACGIASLWIGEIIALFSQSLFLWGYVLGGVLLLVAALVSLTDFCIPSFVYNSVFGEGPRVRLRAGDL